MAVLEYRFASAELGTQAAFCAVLPDAGDDAPVLYLLHGRGDDHTTWLRQTAIERYAERRGLAVVMPDARLSYYRNEVHGQRFWAFVADELPAVCARVLPIADRRADTFVAGLSMGGYGAMQLALRRPGSFAAAASLSGALDVAGAARHDPADPQRARIWHRVFGEADLHNTDADLLSLLRRCEPGALPALWVGCGSADSLLGASRAFVEVGRAAGVQLDLDLTPGGHDWDYWDREIRRVVDWLPLVR